MFAELFLTLMLFAGPHPGRTLYSRTPVDEGAPVVALQSFDVDGVTVSAYRHVEPGETPPVTCLQPGNVACSRPRFNKELRRWERVETWEEGLARYWQISQHAGAIAGSREVAEYMYVIVRHESGNGRRDVHEGSNHRPLRRSTKHEDGGRSWCLGQIMVARHPHTRLPDEKFQDREARELVGLSDAATQLCMGVIAHRVSSIVSRCRRRGGGTVTPACVFLGYAGVAIDADHPLIRARVATWQKVRGVSKTRIGADVRAALGLPAARSAMVLNPAQQALSTWTFLCVAMRG